MKFEGINTKDFSKKGFLKEYGRIEYPTASVKLNEKTIEEINSFFIKEYGDDYPALLTNESIFDSKLHYFLVRNEQGEIIATAKTHIINSKYAENGGLIVDKKCRGRKTECEFGIRSLASLLTQLRLNFIKTIEIKYIYTEPIIRNKFKSQLNSSKAGFNFYGIFPGKYPGKFNFDDVPNIKGDSASTTYARKEVLDGNINDREGSRKIFLPEKYRHLLLSLFNDKDICNIDLHSDEEIKSKTNDFLLKKERLKKGELKGTTFVKINLNNSKAIKVIEKMSGLGYGVNAIIPEYQELKGGKYADVLYMYKISDLNKNIDWNNLPVLSLLKELKKVMMEEYEEYYKDNNNNKQ